MLKGSAIVLSLIAFAGFSGCKSGGGGGGSSGVDATKQLSEVTPEEAKRICDALVAKTSDAEACEQQAVTASSSKAECTTLQAECGADAGATPNPGAGVERCDGDAVAAQFEGCDDITVDDYETCFGTEVPAKTRLLTCDDFGMQAVPPPCAQEFVVACYGGGSGNDGGVGGESGVGGIGGTSGAGGTGTQCGAPMAVPAECWTCSEQTDAAATGMCDQGCMDLLACQVGAQCQDASCLMECCSEHLGSANGAMAVAGPLQQCINAGCPATGVEIMDCPGVESGCVLIAQQVCECCGNCVDTCVAAQGWQDSCAMEPTCEPGCANLGLNDCAEFQNQGGCQ